MADGDTAGISEDGNLTEPKRVVVVRSNPLDRDPWLCREITTLTRDGYSVILLCWDRSGDAAETSEGKELGGFQEVCLNLKAPWGAKILLFLPVWWCFVFVRLMLLRWDAVHAINFDSVVPATIAAKLKHKPIIYEIFDVYADVIVLPTPVRRGGILIDKSFLRLADTVVITSRAQQEELGGIPNKKVVEINNTPPDYVGICNARKNDLFTLFYAGVLFRSRPTNLDKVFRAITNLDGVRLVLAGYGDQVEDIVEWAREASCKVEFLGKISYSEVLERTIASDLLFALYDPVVPAVRYASCNKVFEAMMCSKPIIVTKGTAWAELVEEENCGFSIDPHNVDEIASAIRALKERPELCGKLGRNGRQAFEQKYSRRIMDQRLLDLYKDLMN